jgi:type II secretory pathway pseudopilin PulG
MARMARRMTWADDLMKPDEPAMKGVRVSSSAFTLVEVVLTLTLLIILASVSVPLFRGWQEEARLRKPVTELVRLIKEARLRAMKEKRPYQIAFHQGGFMASRYFSPYLQASELMDFLAQAETGDFRVNPNSDDADADLDAGAGEKPQTDLPLAPQAVKLDDHWEQHYALPPEMTYRLKLWTDVEETEISGEVVKLWVFQPTGLCVPLDLHLETANGGVRFDLEFSALTADITREVMSR